MVTLNPSSGSMKQVLIDLHYLPSIEYFCTLFWADSIVIERHEHFVKQTYRNRCHINTAAGIQALIVPVTGKRGKVPISGVPIDYSSHWQRQHWRALEAAYGKSPFFDYYQEQFHSLIFRNFPLLYDLNRGLLSLCLELLNCRPLLTETKAYEKGGPPTLIDLRSTISPKIPYSERAFYSPAPYHQVFGNKFAANLSIIDLLMCEGPRSMDVIRSSMRVV